MSLALCVMAVTACGNGQTATKSTGNAAEVRATSSSPSSSVPSARDDMQFKEQVRREWNAPSATVIPSDAGPDASSPRMKVAKRLVDAAGPGPIRDQQTAQDALGPPWRRSASNRQWTYLLSRRKPADAPGDVCTREFQVQFNASGAVIALAADDGEDCASDNRPALRPHS
jgi:hypothetical protein